MFVPESRPAVLAVTTEPPAVTTSNSSLLASDCSDVTMTSGLQRMPVRCLSCARRIAIVLGFMPSTRLFNASENCASGFDWAVMHNSYRSQIGGRVENSAGPHYRPDARAAPGRLTGVQWYRP